MQSLTTTYLGQRIALARKRQGLSQAQVADALGWSRATISRIEAGQRRIDSLELVLIAGALGVSALDLLETDSLADVLVEAFAQLLSEPSMSSKKCQAGNDRAGKNGGSK